MTAAVTAVAEVLLMRYQRAAWASAERNSSGDVHYEAALTCASVICHREDQSATLVRATSNSTFLQRL